MKIKKTKKGWRIEPLTATEHIIVDAVIKILKKISKTEKRETSPQTTSANELLSIKTAEKELSISHTTFYRLVKAGKLTPSKIGRRTYIARKEIERFKQTLELTPKEWIANKCSNIKNIYIKQQQKDKKHENNNSEYAPGSQEVGESRQSAQVQTVQDPATQKAVAL